MGTFLDGEALVLFREAIKDGVVPNSKAFVCVLNLCSGRLDFELERQVHARVVKGDWRNYIVDSAIVYFYVQCGDLKSAFCVFDRMVEQDVVSWTTSFTTSGVSKAFGEEKALKFERQIHGFFKSVQWDEEEEHGYMDVHYSTRRPVSSNNLTIHTGEEFGYFEGHVRDWLCREALKLMYRMQAEGIQVDDFVSATVPGGMWRNRVGYRAFIQVLLEH
ncbi:hypothetical protein NC653_005751 [Populus alba x Populus x berolinensis]|uniref:Pentatricopeptide repeat-containing protein n=1 Tax=Populus alba x Populus x berolinensis TaxID=444605 RepID=A0AAD6WBR1_9ROSI|nr:hypothetical protein NC653_005751 [Populus alba x Populus x berolinensis]